jgi:hypothetical protein
MIKSERIANARIDASVMHKTPGVIMKRVALGNETLILERDGYPVMVLLPYLGYRQMLQNLADAQGLTEENITDDPAWQQMKKQESKELNGTIKPKRKSRSRKPETN